jgi:aminoglycoside N3'-acetyltransferase
MRYTKEDIKKSLIEVGIQKNDTVFFSTSLGMVGLPPLYVKYQNDLNKLFLDVIRDILSEGMILVPTYSYTFGKSLASDLANFTKDTPAEIGSFPNYILSQSDVVRSIDPFMSVGCIGKKCKEFLSKQG